MTEGIEELGSSEELQVNLGVWLVWPTEEILEILSQELKMWMSSSQVRMIHNLRA